MKTTELHDKLFNTVTANGMREMTLERFKEALGILWTSTCICPNDEKTGETLCCNHCGKPTARTDSKELPSDDDAGVIAANVASNVRPKLTTQEEAFFIAGFTECVKYLRTSPLLASRDARIRELEEKENICDELAEWSRKYPKGRIYPMSKITMDDELSKIEDKAKALTPPKN